MKTFGKIIICIAVVLAAIGISYLIYNKDESATNANTTNTTQNNTKNETNTVGNKATNDDEYIGLEENVEPSEDQKDEEEPEENSNKEDGEVTEAELTGEEKAVSIVKTKFATAGQTVTFYHMEGTNYVVKINTGTAVTWYLVDGTTWEAEEY